MNKKLIVIIGLSSILLLGACSDTSTDENVDDVGNIDVIENKEDKLVEDIKVNDIDSLKQVTEKTLPREYPEQLIFNEGEGSYNALLLNLSNLADNSLMSSQFFLETMIMNFGYEEELVQDFLNNINVDWKVLNINYLIESINNEVDDLINEESLDSIGTYLSAIGNSDEDIEYILKEISKSL